MIEKKVKKVDGVENKVDIILYIIMENLGNVKFVNKEIVIYVKFLDKTKGSKLIVDSGVPFSMVSERW